jgi:hypothetical protein
MLVDGRFHTKLFVGRHLLVGDFSWGDLLKFLTFGRFLLRNVLVVLTGPVREGHGVPRQRT